MKLALPLGWTEKRYGDITLFEVPPKTANGIGQYVTVDRKQRGFALGFFAHVRPMREYVGGKWEDQLHQDAIRALRTIV